MNLEWLKCVCFGYKSVESKRAEGQLTACEVLVFHHEEMYTMGIGKLSVRQGIWRAVKKIDSSLCAYRRERESSAPFSQCALMALRSTLKLVQTTCLPWKAQAAVHQILKLRIHLRSSSSSVYEHTQGSSCWWGYNACLWSWPRTFDKGRLGDSLALYQDVLLITVRNFLMLYSFFF